MIGELSRKLDVASCVFVVVMVTAFSLHARPFGECSMHHFLPELFKKKLRSSCFLTDNINIWQVLVWLDANGSVISWFSGLQSLDFNVNTECDTNGDFLLHIVCRRGEMSLVANVNLPSPISPHPPWRHDGRTVWCDDVTLLSESSMSRRGFVCLIIVNYPLTTRVPGAPLMISQPVHVPTGWRKSRASVELFNKFISAWMMYASLHEWVNNSWMMYCRRKWMNW